MPRRLNNTFYRRRLAMFTRCIRTVTFSRGEGSRREGDSDGRRGDGTLRSLG